MIKSVQKALRILEILSDNQFQCVSLKNISDRTGIEKSTRHHLLETMCAEGYVQNVGSNGKYLLGPNTYLLTRFGKYNDTLIATCHPLLNFLAKKTKKTVLLAVFANNHKFIIDKIDSDENIFRHNAQIFTDDVYRTATGRILLSYMQRDEIFDFYQKYGPPKQQDWAGIKTFNNLCVALRMAKKQQYIKTESKIDDDLLHVGLGKAIFKDNKCVGAVGIACSVSSSSEFVDNPFSVWETELYLRTVKEINRRLKFS